jgi:hypothetical protein
MPLIVTVNRTAECPRTDCKINWEGKNTHRCAVTFPKQLSFLEMQYDVTHKPIAIDYGLFLGRLGYQPLEENKEKSWPTNGSISTQTPWRRT